ncbi:MAG: helix-turn-helix domain-containing protein [Moorea sp. SIO2B7]|nr:helix-turn-helix domain-containing protein [Moorena sp. SIO2B7]
MLRFVKVRLYPNTEQQQSLGRLGNVYDYAQI